MGGNRRSVRSGHGSSRQPVAPAHMIMKIIDIDVFAPDEIAMRRFPVRLSYIDADDLHQEAWDAAAEIVERTHRAYGMREVTSMCAYIEALVAEKTKGPEARPRANNN